VCHTAKLNNQQQTRKRVKQSLQWI